MQSNIVIMKYVYSNHLIECTAYSDCLSIHTQIKQSLRLSTSDNGLSHKLIYN